MSGAAPYGKVLVVVTDPADRRALFETLDAHEFEAVYTAKDFSQARAFLAQPQPIDAVVLEFRGDAADALGFCTRLQESNHPAPVLGLATADDLALRWRTGVGPVVVAEWLRSPVNRQETLQRLRQVMRNGPKIVDRDSGREIGAVAERSIRAADKTAPTQKEGKPLQLQGLAHGLPVHSGVVPELGGDQTDSAERGIDWRHGPEQEWVAARVAAGCGLPQQPAVNRVQDLALQGEKPPGQFSESLSALERCVGPQQLGSREEARDLRFGSRCTDDALGEHAWRDALRTAVALSRCAPAQGEQLVATLVSWLDADALWLVDRANAGRDCAAVLYHAGDPRLPADFFLQLHKRLTGNDPIVWARDAYSTLGCALSDEGARFDSLAAVAIVDRFLVPVRTLVVLRHRPFEVTGMVEVMQIAAARLGLEADLEGAQQDSRTLAMQDALTRIPNRLLFKDRLEETIHEAQRNGEMFAVMFVDIDRFKDINDRLGHVAGDEVLLMVARRMRACIRASDTVARFAGDEFTVILRQITQRDDALRIADKICRALEQPLMLDHGGELRVTASIGISFFPEDAATAERILQSADQAMYQAKDRGRNTFQAYLAGSDSLRRQHLALEVRLREAEHDRELHLCYQPQIAADSEELLGVEALLRWEHPDLGTISPGVFVPIAEETGLIVAIGAWVLRRACFDARRWYDRYHLPLRVGVNLSAVQLRQSGFVDLVRRSLLDSGLPAHLLELEVTESISVKSIPNLIETLRSLREIGVSIAIDDFGTGQSSLDYLRRFPATRVKIDQVFVRNIGVDPDDEAIVRATIDMAHNLGLSVVAEGVESEQQCSFLRERGCEELQGFLFSKPLAAREFEQLLSERERILATEPLPT